MRWSSVLKKDKSTDVQSDLSVLDYTPKQFEFGPALVAEEYLREKERGSDFVMSDVMRTTTGIEEIEKQSEEKKIEQKVLEKLATLQKEAYEQAYNLGLEEGHKKAYDDKSSELSAQVQGFLQLCGSLNNIKEEMIHQNEAHIVRLIYDLACRIAFDHIEENKDSVVQVIKKAIEKAQAEENINILVSNEQLALLESLKQENHRDTEFLKKVKLESSDQVSVGSCIVETNYGVIDASIEQRVIKLWTELKQSIPKVKSPIEPT